MIGFDDRIATLRAAREACDLAPAEDLPVVEWEPPIPLRAVSRLPEFPTEALPGWLRAYVEALALSTQTPRDMAGLLSLAVLATVCQGSYRLRVRADWEEPLALFAVIALRPGNRKSAVFRALVAPLVAWERAEAERLRSEVAASESRRRILEARLAAAEKAAAKSGEPDSAEVTAAREALAGWRPMRVPRLLADDATPEALVGLLAENRGRLGVLSAEGTLFEVLGGRYSAQGAVNVEAVLKGHAGDTIRVDRRGRPPEYVEHPALSVGLTVQPDVLHSLTRRPEFRGRGLLARFLYALPADPLGYREASPSPVPADVTAAYTSALGRLLAVDPTRGDAGEAGAAVLTLTADAREWLVSLLAEIEADLRPGGALAHVADWGGKLAGAVARIAALLHMAEHGPDGGGRPVELASVEAARRIGEWARAHALEAFATMGADPARHGAEELLAWIGREGRAEFTKNEAFNALRATFRTSEALDAPLRVLEDHGYIRERENRPGPQGGRPSRIFEVHPLAQNPQNPQNPLSVPGFASSAGFAGEIGSRNGAAGLPAAEPVAEVL